MLGKEYGSPLQNTFGTAVLGTPDFVEMITATQLAVKEVDRAVPAIQQFKACPEPEEILKAVAAVMGETEKLARQVGMYLCHKYSGKKLREIGNFFNVGETAIAEARRLLSRKMEQDKKLCEVIKKVMAELNI